MKKARPAVILFSLLAAWVSPILAQFADEVWVEPRFFDLIDPPPGDCSGFLGTQVRPYYLSTLTDPDAWPTTLGRTSVFSALHGLLALPCEGNERVTDDELVSLASFLNQRNIRVNFNVGALRINHDYFCAFDPDDPAENISGENYGRSTSQLLRRWYEAGGRVDYLSADHPLWWMFVFQDNGQTDPDCADMTLEQGAEEVADFFATIRDQIDLHFPGEPYDPEIGLWENAALGFQTPDGTQILPKAYAAGIAPGVDLNSLIDAIQVALQGHDLDLGFFNIDWSPDAVERDGTPTEWDFSRVIALEETVRDLGLRVGISNHLGPCAIDEAPPCGMDGANNVDDQWAHDTFVRYAREYVLAGGNPDFLQAYSWHLHPTLTGPESTTNTYMNIVRDVLVDVYPDAVDMPLPTDYFSAGLGRWSLEGTWNIVSEKLYSGSDGLHTATLANETFDSLDATVRLQLTGDLGNGWAALSLRRSEEGHAPWKSGYLAQLRVLNDIPRVYLTKPGQTLAATPVTVDFIQTEVDFRAQLTGNRIRLYLNGERVVDVTDSSDPSYSSGYVSLSSLDQQASFDDFSVQRIQLADHAFEDRFTDDVLTGWTTTTPPGGSWSTSAGELTGIGLASVTGFEAGNVRFAATLRLGSGSGGWAGINVRKLSEAHYPWSGGYTVQLRDDDPYDGLLLLYRPGAVPGGTLATYSTGLDFTAEPIRLEVAVSGHRIRVYLVDLDTRESDLVFDIWDDATPAPGAAGIVAVDRYVIVDEVVVEELVEHSAFLSSLP